MQGVITKARSKYLIHQSLEGWVSPPVRVRACTEHRPECKDSLDLACGVRE